MSADKFQYGDRVHHRKRPEWGVGTVVRADEAMVGDEHTQRLSVRFPNAGIKTLSGQHADLERVGEEGGAAQGVTHERPTVAAFDSMNQSGWLAPLAERKVEEVMISLPMEVRDPFNSLKHRLKVTLDLYRFDRSGRGLVAWAAAQSGLDDPLTRFSRQELEQHFDRWSFEREAHLRRLLQEARNGELLRELLPSAPPAARAAVQKITGSR